jgi:hypothetical protein
VKRFTVYTNILTERSLFLKAARKPEWLAEDPRKPINLEDEDPEVFQAYLHCVYFGSETLDEHFDNFLREVGTRTQSEPAPVLLGDLQRFECPGAHELEDFFDERLPTPERTQVVYERKIAGVKRFVHVYFENGEEATQALQCYSDNARGWKFAFAASSIDLAVEGFDSLIQLYLLADKMQDLRTSNMVSDEIINFSVDVDAVPSRREICMAYDSTVKGNPLRAMLSGLWVCQAKPDCLQRLQESGYPRDFFQDVATNLLQAKFDTKAILEERIGEDDYDTHLELAMAYPLRGKDQYFYHQHDERHPKCQKS